MCKPKPFYLLIVCCVFLASIFNAKANKDSLRRADSIELDRYLTKLLPGKDTVKSIDLDGYSVRTINPKVFLFTNLEVLSLSGTNISSIPPQITKLTKLSHLYLSRTKIKEFPKVICKIKSLEGLDLNGTNKTIFIPNEISNLTNLKSLNLMGCKIIKIPDSFSKLVNLTALLCCIKKDQEMPKGLKDHPNFDKFMTRACT